MIFSYFRIVQPWILIQIIRTIIYQEQVNFYFDYFFTAYNKIILQHSKFLGDGNELALCNNSIPDLADFFNDIECMKNEIKWKC